MELSRRGVVGALGAVSAVGVIGLVGASTVNESEERSGTAAAGSDGVDGGSDDDSDVAYVDADPNAPFAARLVGDTEDRLLFDASGLVHVEGVHPEGDEHLVIIELDDDAIAAVRAAMGDEDVVDAPEAFEIRMTLDGTEVRRIDLDEETAAALTDDSWEGIVTLPFSEPDVATDVYESLADE